MGDLREEPNGVVLSLDDSSSSSCCSSSSSSCLSLFSSQVWARAEEATEEIIRQVQPTVVSEERRRDVIDYVQRLLKCYLGCEVFPFGSVPLKTYLPDGDIDLTAFCGLNFEEGFANDVYSVLEAEDRNPVAEFVVKDVQYIRAEVKLVKCLVQNIVVDISFNQIGGLCALCFLEEVDRLIGKDHLFKRSIILIKAWCYYESRILGAHHGLISTYALETLVLYIFHLFHSSLNGPLAVLYKFLDYFSKFDWENYCVSLSGPVPASSLPEIVAERPNNGGGELLLSDEFIGDCVKKFYVPSRGNETHSRTFIQKHLNIVDPLKENNNLGRSVSKGNFFRIRSAFSFGARKLGQILVQPQENVAEEVRRFFTNTLERHGKGYRPDVQELLMLPNCNGFAPEMLAFSADRFQEDGYSLDVESINSSDQSSDCRIGSEDARLVVIDGKPGFSDEGACIEQQRGSKRAIPSTSSAASLSMDEMSAASAGRLSGDANDLATCGIENLRITNQADKASSSVDDERASVGEVPPHGSHIYFPHAFGNGTTHNGYLDEVQVIDLGGPDERLFSGKAHTYSKDGNFRSWEHANNHLSNNHELLTLTDSNFHYPSMNSDARSLQDAHSVHRSACPAGAGGSHETPKLLPDLTGDIDCHLESLGYGRWWYDYILMMPLQPLHLPPPPPPLFHRKNPWDAIQQSVHLGRDMVPHANGVVPRPAFFSMNPQLVHGTAFGVDEMSKVRGTGTYLPVTNHHFYRDRPSLVKGRGPGQSKSPRTNGRSLPFDHSQQIHSPVRQGNGRPRVSDSHVSSPRGKVKQVNGYVHMSEKAEDFVALGPPPTETTLQEIESSRQSASGYAPESQSGEPVFVLNDDRLGVQSFRLKDDEDFPPLSV